MLEHHGVGRIEARIQHTAVDIDGGSDHVRERTKTVAKPPVPSGEKDHGISMAEVDAADRS